MSQTPLVIWRFRDGKPGHEQQTLGLAEALARLTPAEVIDFDVRESRSNWLDVLFCRFPSGQHQPKPVLLLGAGHATHLPLLAARRAFGGRAVVLMKPGLPRFLFDFVIVPWHDGLPAQGNVIVTQGVLNAVRPGPKQSGKALVLVGGVSKHFPWDDASVLAQLEAILQRFPQAVVTDSRRTPDSLRAVLSGRCADRYQPWDRCPPGWLAAELATAETVWVSEDSVSMIYEALTAGGAVGLIGLPPPAQVPGRLVRGITALVESGKVVRFADWQAGRPLQAAMPPLAEADRVAGLLWRELESSGQKEERA